MWPPVIELFIIQNFQLLKLFIIELFFDQNLLFCIRKIKFCMQIFWTIEIIEILNYSLLKISKLLNYWLLNYSNYCIIGLLKITFYWIIHYWRTLNYSLFKISAELGVWLNYSLLKIGRFWISMKVLRVHSWTLC